LNIKRIFQFAVGPIGAAALSLITLPIITWYFNASDIGKMSMLQVTISFTLLLFSLGLDQAYVREYHESIDKQQLLKLTYLPGISLLVITLVALSLKPTLLSETLFQIQDAKVSVLIVICLLSAFTSRYLSLVLRMQEKGLAFSMSQLLPKLLLLVVIISYTMFADLFDLSKLIIAHTAALSLVFCIFAWNTRVDWRKAIVTEFDLQKLRLMLNYSSPLIVSGLAYWGLTSVDKIFLRTFSTFSELGVYSVAISFAATGMLVQSIFSIIWAPSMYKLKGKKERAERAQLVSGYMRSIIVMFICLIGIFSQYITFFIHQDFYSVRYLLPACICVPLLYTMTEVTSIGLGIMKKSFYIALATVLALLLNLVGNYILIPMLGASGAAISTAMAFTFFYILKTELAIKAWVRFRVRYSYISVIFIISVSCCLALYQEQVALQASIIYVLIFIIELIVNRHSIVLIFNKVSGKANA
jgi:O-antigen/teichoic acid export membrane protein